MVPVNMPVIGQDIPTGIVKEWLKKEGDTVSREEVIATVESEKATFDVEAPADGILIRILHHEEEEVDVLTPIAFIGKKEEIIQKEIGNDLMQSTETKNIAVKEQSVSTASEKTSIEVQNERIFISPLARRIAEKERIEISSVIGSGLGGRIIKRNILDAIKAGFEEKPKSEIKTGKEVPFTRIRQIIADRLSKSKQTVPHFYLFADVDMSNAISVREQLMIKGIHATITDLVIYSAGRAVTEFPLFNSHVFSNSYISLDDINAGLAVSTDEGLRVPVIADIDKDDIAELAVKTKKIAAEARLGKMNTGLKAGITITSLGMYSISGFMPIINAPEPAILAIGRSTPQVVTDGKNISIRNIMTLTLACDHRLIDGAYAAQFLEHIKDSLEKLIINS